jgi:hypothetical protein
VGCRSAACLAEDVEREGVLLIAIVGVLAWVTVMSDAPLTY